MYVFILYIKENVKWFCICNWEMIKSHILIHYWMNQWMNGWMNQWINESMNQWM
jgi:hypothetical protein